jgi:hypothetical protein
MSFLHITCNWCGERYTTGIVGSWPVGTGHVCTVDKPCSIAGCSELGRALTIKSVVRRDGETPEELALREMETCEFRCIEHIRSEGLIILGFQPRG